VFIYENRKMKPIEIVLRRSGEGESWRGNLRCIISTHVNITIYSPVNYYMLIII
jgi:hypothetical protein